MIFSIEIVLLPNKTHRVGSGHNGNGLDFVLGLSSDSSTFKCFISFNSCKNFVGYCDLHFRDGGN